MLVLAVVLPLIVGGLSSRLPDAEKRPRGRALIMTVLRGYPNALALFVVVVWMMFVAPIGQLRAIVRRWDSVHVPIAVKPGRYDRVVTDLAGALEKTGIEVGRRRAPWAYEVPGKVLAVLGGEGVRALVPVTLWQLVHREFEMTLHPMDLAMLGKPKTLARARAAIVRELTFTEAYQTWTKEAQVFEDRLARAGSGDLEGIGADLKKAELDYEEWEILYRLLLQVRLRLSPTETDEVDERDESVPPLRERVAAAVRVLAGQQNGGGR
jgi:hypothetical protein